MKITGRNSSDKLLAIASFCMLLVGCRTIQVSESDLMQPDIRPDAHIKSDQRIERSTVQTSVGEIAVTRIFRPGNKIAVLYCGGNQFRTSVSGGSVSAAFPESVDLILFDYPGYGLSSGSPTVDSLMQAATAVYDQFLSESSAGYDRKGVYGSSMGGFIASHVAAERSPDFLMLEGTAANTTQLMRSLVPWFAKPFIDIKVDPKLADFDNVEKLKGFEGRALLMVGSADTQTKPIVMREFAAALATENVDVRYTVIAGRGHGNVLSHSEARREVSEFLGDRE